MPDDLIHLFLKLMQACCAIVDRVSWLQQLSPK